MTLSVGFANRLKLQFRHEPLFPSDATFGRDAGFLASVVGVKTILTVVLLACLSMAVVLLIGRLSRSRLPNIHRSRRAIVCARILTAALALAALFQAASFNQPGNLLRQAFETSGADWAPYNQGFNYRQNGFVAGLLYNTPAPAMPRPPGYSESRMRELAQSYASVAAHMNRNRDASAMDGVNVVLVLSESFSDPSRLARIGISKDPIPFAHSLAGSATTGTMLSQGFGGGTSNLEFEALTGMSTRMLAPPNGRPISKSRARNARLPFDRRPDEESRAPSDRHPPIQSVLVPERFGLFDFGIRQSDLPRCHAKP